ncbi:phage tail sheath subtilisin-like domain-containing protein [Fredinandcohnia humi]
MAGGNWTPTESKVRPGLYINFVSAAVAQIQGGARGVVAIALKNYGANVSAKEFHLIESEKQAVDLFGADNIKSIKLALQGGAKEVLVYTLPVIDGTTVTEDTAYTEAFDELDTRPFNVFVFDGEVADAAQDKALTWAIRNKSEGKHFMVVFGGNATADLDPAVGNARSIRLAEEYAVNLINGVILNGEPLSSAQFSPYIAGLIAGTPINKSITYAQIRVDDVTKRMTNAQIKEALTKGSLVLVHDGEKVKIERGICTDKKKIRTIRARQAISTDITKTAADSYIGKIDNNVDGQKALISAIKAYLERLAVANVVTNEIVVDLDPNFESIGDKVYLFIKVTEVDSMEEIYLTIQV